MREFTTEHRPGDGAPAVVFMSALFAGGWIWDHPYDTLARAGRTVLRTNEAICAMDRQIAGSIERLGDTLLDACDAAGLGDIVVCANSLGGLVAIDLAGRRPDRVRGIVVSGAPGLSPDPDVGLSFDRRGSVRPTGEDFGRRMVAALFHQGCHFSPERMAEAGELINRPDSMVSMARSLKATRAYRVGPALDKVACPALYVWGRHDRMTPAAPWMEALAGRDGHQTLLIEESGHIPMVECAEEYTAALEPFVDRCAGALA
ncbi:alpha/beta hydrolase [Streptosporangium sp. NPDC002524]|uniref:alpha/beta fold hydrolase n=1 Tax=Streptosporangium sp. NPDC002524 TaxID=3154537 RepID=UPI00332193FB